MQHTIATAHGPSWRASRRAENFFDECYSVFGRFMFAREQPKVALNGFGRASRAAKDAKTTRLESVKC